MSGHAFLWMFAALMAYAVRIGAWSAIAFSAVAVLALATNEICDAIKQAGKTGAGN